MNISSRRSRDLQDLTSPHAIRPQTLFARNGLIFGLCTVACLALAPQASAQGRLDAQYEATLAGIPVGKGSWTRCGMLIRMPTTQCGLTVMKSSGFASQLHHSRPGVRPLSLHAYASRPNSVKLPGVGRPATPPANEAPTPA